jgi:hypothetical protein
MAAAYLLVLRIPLCRAVLAEYERAAAIANMGSIEN